MVFRRREAGGANSSTESPALPLADESALREHFVTCFDHRFVLQGLALHESLLQHHPEALLWVVCLDAEVERQLQRLRLRCARLVPLRAIETPELLQAKRDRTWAEYIYPLTPFLFPAVMDRDASVQRVTYLDADLFFFKNLKILLRERAS